MNLDIPGYRLGATIGHDGDIATCRGQRTRDRLPVAVVARRPTAPPRPDGGGGGDRPGGGPGLLDLTALNGIDGVVPVLECGITRGDHRFAVFERPPEGSLAERLLRGRLRAREAMAVGLAISQALVGAHAAGFRHGRLGPSSIVFGPGGRIRLTGFMPVSHPGTEADDVAALGRLLLGATEPPRSSTVAPSPGAGAGSAELPADLRVTLTRAAGAGTSPGAPSSAAALLAGLEAVADAHGWPVLRPVYALGADARRRARARRRRRRRRLLLVPAALFLGVAAAASAVAVVRQREDRPPAVAVRTAGSGIEPEQTARPGGEGADAGTTATPSTLATSGSPEAGDAGVAVETTATVASAVPARTGSPPARATTVPARATTTTTLELDRSTPPPVWLVEPDGSVTDSATGATWLGPASSPTVDVALRVDGFGGWQLLADGRIRPFGDAPPLGAGRLPVPSGERPVRLVADATESAAWAVFADGGVTGLGVPPPSPAAPAPAAPIVSAARSVGGAGYLTLDSAGRISGAGDAVVRGQAEGLLDAPLVDLLVFNEAHVVVAADGSFAVISGQEPQAGHDVGRLAVGAEVAAVDHAAGRILITDTDGVVTVFGVSSVVSP